MLSVSQCITFQLSVSKPQLIASKCSKQKRQNSNHQQICNIIKVKRAEKICYYLFSNHELFERKNRFSAKKLPTKTNKKIFSSTIKE
jgi:TnpA family transposase